MRKKRQFAKSRKLPSQIKQNQKQQIYIKVVKNIRKANKRIKSLEYRYKTGTWATKNLKNRLDTDKNKHMWQNNRIKIPGKNATSTELASINKAVDQFLNSATSTKKGIKAISIKTKKSIKDTFNIEVEEDEEMITDEDVNDFYNMLGTDDFSYFADKIHASTMWDIIHTSDVRKESQSQYLDRIENYLVINDQEVRNKAIRLYNKYVM